MPPDEDVSADPASPAPDPDPDPELALEPELVPALEPAVELEPEVDEPPAHDELVAESELMAGALGGEVVVVVLGSELVVSVVEPVVVVVGVSVLCVEFVVDDGVVLAGAVLSELVAGQPAVVVPVVVVAGVDPESTVGSVWVWVRPAGGVGVVLVFVPAFVVATPPCLVGVLAVDLCVVGEALSAAGLCRWVTTAACR